MSCEIGKKKFISYEKSVEILGKYKDIKKGYKKALFDGEFRKNLSN